jgi:ZIP zinc/iron transport family
MLLEIDCNSKSLQEYNFSLHLFSVFIIFVISTVGCISAIYASRKESKSLKLTRSLIVLKLFGIGVITGTAWIHVLPEAFKAFLSPCLSNGWEIYGGAFVGLFGMIAAFLVQLLEVAGHSHVHSPAHILSASHERHSSEHVEHNHSHSHSHDTDPLLINTTLSSTSLILPREECENEITKQITAIVLEFGILIHSVVIGISLGVSDDDAFITLLLAISFHQLFEGIALGLVVGETLLKSMTKIILGFLFPIATPLGIVIGIVLRESYNGKNSTILVLKGIFNSLSAGILIYNTYAEMMAFQVTQNDQLKKETKMFKIGAYLAMYVGAVAMAIIGIWV